MTAKEREQFTALEQELNTIKSERANIENQARERIKTAEDETRAANRRVTEAEQRTADAEQRATDAEHRATEAEGQVEGLRGELNQADEDIFDLNEELSKVASPTAQAQAEVLTSQDGRQFHLTVESFVLPSGRYERADVTSGSRVLEQLVKVNAAILQEVTKATTAAKL